MRLIRAIWYRCRRWIDRRKAERHLNRLLKRYDKHD
jgi:hypothetical protein